MELDLNSKTLMRQTEGLPIVEAIDMALLNKQAATPQREYLGGSFVANACERMIQYQYVGAEKDMGFAPHVLRIFERGHIMEDMVAMWLRNAGFILKTEGADGRQFGFASAGGRFRGHADGVITGWSGEGEPPAKFPALWESKALNQKNYDNVVRLGVKKAKPVYYGQVALYQYHLDLMNNPCVFTVVNANTMELHVELIPFDPVECQRLIDRAARIIENTDAGTQMPRPYTDADGFGCRFCDYKTKCWA